VAVLVRLV